MLSFRRLAGPALAPAILFGTLSLAACGDGSGPETPRVTTVTVTPNVANVVVNTTLPLSAAPKSSNGTVVTGKQVTWASSNNSTATVTIAGVVTGAAPGVVQISATVDGITGSATITVVPPPIASVTITPTTPTANVGATVPFTATLRDAGGNVLTGRNVAWSSQNPAVATINQTTGLATAVSVGTTQITATAETMSASVTLIVASPATIVSITPDPLTPGASGTITGTGFSATPSNNIVTIGGFNAQVTAATTTSLSFTVPANLCLPSGNATVVAQSSSSSSAQKTVPFQTNAAPINVSAGQQVLITNPANFCLQIPSNSGTEAFLIGVQSVSEVPTELTPVTVRGAIPSTAIPAPPITVVSRTASQSVALNPATIKTAERWRRRRAAELTLRTRELATLASMVKQRVNLLSRSTASLASATQTIPPSAAVGDTLNIKVPTTASCATSVAIRAVVRLVGQKSIWLEDVGNPAGGFATADYQALANKMDNNIFRTDSAYFGNPTDLDANGKIGIVVTKEINKITNILGFTSSTDQFPTVQCSASNFGEIYYAIAPDPTKIYPSPNDPNPYTVADAKADAPVLIAHEFSHLIQFGRRIQSGATAFLSIWEAEGQATLAEEVNGHTDTGRMIAQNYGFSVAFNRNASNLPLDSLDWYVASFVDLALYYGFLNQTTNVGTAPEECGWLGQQNRGNIGPCIGGRNVYGVSWSFLRWLSDQFGPTFPGGEQGLQKQLINSSLNGFNNIVNVVQQPIDQLLAQWAASLYTDDRITNATARLRFTSWNFFDVENGLRPVAKLTPRARGFSDFTDAVNVRAASTAYYRVSGSNHGPMAVSVAGAITQLPNTMRLWVVRLQ